MKPLSEVVGLFICLFYVCGAGVSATSYVLHDYEEDSNVRPRLYGGYLRPKTKDSIQSVVVDTPIKESSFWTDSDEVGPLGGDVPEFVPPIPDDPPGEIPSMIPPPPEKPITNIDLASLERLIGQVDNLVSELKAQQDKITELENINKRLQDKVDLVEQQVKTNNLVFFNVPESKHENHKTTQQKVLQLLNRVMKVRTNAGDIAMALRADGNSSSDRPIVVKFTNFATKMRVVANKNRLGRSDVKVVADYSEQVNRRRSELMPYLQVLRSRGHHAFLVYDKLMVDGVPKTLQELQAEEALDPETYGRPPCEYPLPTTEEQPNLEPDEQVEEVEEVEVDPVPDYEE